MDEQDAELQRELSLFASSSFGQHFEGRLASSPMA